MTTAISHLHPIDLPVDSGQNWEAYCKQYLEELAEQVRVGYAANQEITTLLKLRSDAFDTLIQQVWQRQQPAADIAIIALGGYSRELLHPYSDLDILFLIPDELLDDPVTYTKISRLLQLLWDIGVKVGHNVCTSNHLLDLAKQDIVSLTNLLYARLICGSNVLYQSLLTHVRSHKLCSPQDFLKKKLLEQEQRHEKFNRTGHQIEPNIKNSPGTIRDIETIEWLSDYLHSKDTSSWEYQTLSQLQHFFWRVRLGIHLLSKRQDDRLLLDYQLELAKQFGFADSHRQLAVEQFMHQYYQNVKTTIKLCGIVTAQLKEKVQKKKSKPKALGPHLLQIDRAIAVKVLDDMNADIIFEILLTLAKNTKLQTIAADTLRQIIEVVEQSTTEQLQTSNNRERFVKILAEHQGICKVLEVMNRYGILGAYLPAFKAIEGLMQFDLYHIYTVDSHSLSVVKNINRFLFESEQQLCSLCAQIVKRIARPEILYIAALFHDIGKGRHGDHSILGAEDAYQFCQSHGFSDSETELIQWLVQQHLLMSITAQRKDISDEQVIAEFAKQIKTKQRLDFLYVLTVADIYATNPNLWNTWRHTLLKNLYEYTRHFLEAELLEAPKRSERIKNHRNAALNLLAQNQDIDHGRAIEWLNQIDEDYFIRYKPEQIAWQVPLLLNHQDLSKPLIAIQKHQSEGATDIFIFVANQPNIFAALTGTLGNLALSIVAARVFIAKNGCHYHTYTVLEANGRPIDGQERAKRIKRSIARLLKNYQPSYKHPMKQSRQLRAFSSPAFITVTHQPNLGYSLVNIITADRLGLLAQIANSFALCHLKILEAKIATLGEKVEDVFFVCNQHNQVLTDQEAKDLETKLKQVLSDESHS